MVEQPGASLDRCFAALADPTRRAILARLARGEATVTEIAAPFDISLAAVSKHLVMLEKAGLVARRREGRTHHLSLQPRAMREADAWMADYRRFWEARLDALDRMLAEEDDA